MDRRGCLFLAAVACALSAAPARAAEPPRASPALAALIQDARAKQLAQSRDWQVMLHYRPTTFGGWKSQADGMGFFFAGKAGKTDRDAELEATITALLRPPVRDPSNPETMHPQCLFPARYAWLKQQLGPAAFIDQPCPILDTWRTGISAEAATLVYATAYLNSPASMYGHTFLRLSRATGEGNPLLDYAVNYAADADTNNGLVYAIAGLTGRFQGHFYMVPYYAKVQEYSNMESRDLWEYQLALTPEQVAAPGAARVGDALDLLRLLLHRRELLVPAAHVARGGRSDAAPARWFRPARRARRHHPRRDGSARPGPARGAASVAGEHDDRTARASRRARGARRRAVGEVAARQHRARSQR